ncbi:MAG: hypothetical protein ACE5PM_04935 [Candidatus Hydrothermarchaeales archaeon]
MDEKKIDWTKVVITGLALLLVTSILVVAQPTTSDRAEEFWDEMREYHEEMHGDDFEEHHQQMHGEDWEEHVASCHGGEDLEGMHSSSGMMGTPSILV